MQVLAVFGWVDWGVVGVYFAVVLTVGFLVGRKREKGAGTEEYFLAGRSLPTWAIAISLVATMLSATTFVGVPDIAFGGDLSYLILNLGGIFAAFIVAAIFFVPRLYRAGTVTIYGFLAQRFGETARLAVSCAFILGRLLSSGARLFTRGHSIVPAAVSRPGRCHQSPARVDGNRADRRGRNLLCHHGRRAGGGVGGHDSIRDCPCHGTLHDRHTAPSPAFVVSANNGCFAHPAPASGASKLPHPSMHPSIPGFQQAYTIWTAIIGNTFLMIAAFGVDHDLAQRFLIAKSSFRGGLSVIASQFIGIVVVFFFLAIGLLLYIFYQRPDLAGAVHQASSDGKAIYPWFLLNELPAGLAGLSMAGFFAIAQGSLDSAMNALAASIVADVYLPLRKRLRPGASAENAKASKPTVAAVGATMVGFAMLCAAVYDQKTKILDFVLGLMTFALSGMLGVFLTALFTKAGNTASVIAALLAGAGVVALLQDGIMRWWTPAIFGREITLAWPWWMPLGTMVAFHGVCRGETFTQLKLMMPRKNHAGSKYCDDFHS